MINLPKTEPQIQEDKNSDLPENTGTNTETEICREKLNSNATWSQLEQPNRLSSNQTHLALQGLVAIEVRRLVLSHELLFKVFLYQQHACASSFSGGNTINTRNLQVY